ncbi:hypothetical protein MmiHf6_09500 [Methanimicrococcus hongohii]|uniref:Uncharacterized protein n=1 Tax=Methanimicrococcus hongohii TaxID=3028295 RepID=A0AA96V917_9EURY|nr:hypothetical protein [Methanimicrococcus sp. Hf6]WNY23641.1 hypothetical protein MmiHf6_09500 [Methanimicrococcus sp. Hf6]
MSKISTFLIALLVMFALVGVASAGSGTQADPYTVLYVGYSYVGGGGSMCNGAGDNTVISQLSGDNVYYTTDYINIDYDAYYYPTAASYNAAATAIDNAGTYDFLIAEMAYGGYSYGATVDAARESFYNATRDSTSFGIRASIFSDDYINSYAPENFNFRDDTSYGQATNLTYTPRFQNAVDNVNYNNWPSMPDYEDFLAYLN